LEGGHVKAAIKESKGEDHGEVTGPGTLSPVQRQPRRETALAASTAKLS
jgi:hypothetical protein